jgi:putative transcriptional regulator
MTFAESIRITRTKLRLTQEELAHELGVSFATVNRWENGSYNPSRLAQKAFHDFCKDKSVCIEDYDD